MCGIMPEDLEFMKRMSSDDGDAAFGMGAGENVIEVVDIPWMHKTDLVILWYCSQW